MASSALKISALESLVTLSGSEEILVAYLGKNFKIKLSDLFTSVEMPTKASLGLDQVDNTSDRNKPVSNATHVALNSKADVGHEHTVTSIIGLADILATKADVNHSHSVDSITGLQAILDLKANSVHGHQIDQIQGLPDALNNKAGSVHSHLLADVTGLTDALATKVDQTVFDSEMEALVGQLANAVTTEDLAQIVATLAPLTHRHDASDIDNLPDGSVAFTASEW